VQHLPLLPTVLLLLLQKLSEKLRQLQLELHK
jgi:hypothetical protein